MPIQKVPGGYRWGDRGKIYPNREDAIKQMKAIKASQSKEEDKKMNKSLKRKRLEKKQEEENKLKKQEDLKNIIENIENLIESYGPYVTNNTFSRNGVTYDVDKLIKLTYKNKPILFNINLLKEFLIKNPIYNTRYHQDRIYQADLSAPILVWKSPSNVWNIIDGKHRVQKALDEGKGALPAYVISDNELEQVIKKY